MMFLVMLVVMMVMMVVLISMMLLVMLLFVLIAHDLVQVSIIYSGLLVLLWTFYEHIEEWY